MRFIALHVCPVWERAGRRRPGIRPDRAEGEEVVGWCCVVELELGGERIELLA